jgi:hypothetical protein
LQSKAGIENREYKAQRSILADVDARKLSKEEHFAHGEELLKARMPRPAAHKPAEPKAAAPAAGGPMPPPQRPAAAGQAVVTS